MMQLVYAEWIKVTGHRRALFWMLGIFPTGGVIFFTFTAFAVGKPAADRLVAESLANWSDLLLLAWLIPSNFFGRLFLIAFIAYCFAYESQCETWKNLVPRQVRRRLICAKFIASSSMVIMTFVLMSVILLLGGLLLCWLAQVPVEPPLRITELRHALGLYSLGAGLAFAAFLISGVFAAAGAIHSRSILGGTLFGMMTVLSDPVLVYGSQFLSRFLTAPWLLHLQRLSPWYNVENLRSWFEAGLPTDLIASSFVDAARAVPVDGAAMSSAVLTAWISLGVFATIWIFERQDIT